MYTWQTLRIEYYLFGPARTGLPPQAFHPFLLVGRPRGWPLLPPATPNVLQLNAAAAAGSWSDQLTDPLLQAAGSSGSTSGCAAAAVASTGLHLRELELASSPLPPRGSTAMMDRSRCAPQAGGPSAGGVSLGRAALASAGAAELGEPATTRTASPGGVQAEEEMEGAATAEVQVAANEWVKSAANSLKDQCKLKCSYG
jgi:hypothetical protein